MSTQVLIERFLRLANLIAASEDKPRGFGTAHKLTRAEIHTIEAIGHHPGLSVTDLARVQGISKSAVSQMLSRLKSKRLVVQSNSAGSERDTDIGLTKLGALAYKNHEAGHRSLYEAIEARLKELSPDALDSLSGIFAEIEGYLAERIAEEDHDGSS
jgi:DNA-binding MarR family transcriptional regulator